MSQNTSLEVCVLCVSFQGRLVHESFSALCALVTEVAQMHQIDVPLDEDQGELFPAELALSLGLVDALVVSLEVLLIEKGLLTNVALVRSQL